MEGEHAHNRSVPRIATALGLCGLLALAIVLASGPGAEGASDGLVTKLRQEQCPELALPRERKHNQRQVDLALRGRFVIAGDRVKLKPKVNWFKNQASSQAFQQQLHTLRWMDVLFHAYRGGDRGAIRQARKLAVDWVRQNPLHPPKGKGKEKPKPVPRLAWQNLVAGDRAAYLGYLTRAASCAGVLPKGPAKILLRSIQEHGDYLAYGKGYYESNHGLFTDLGLYLLASRYFPFFGQAPQWESVARERFPRTLEGRTSGSGVWLEHSADYHFLAIRMAERFLEFTGPDPRTEAALEVLKSTAPWFVAPDGRLPLIGDTSASRPAADFRRAAKQLNGYRTFLDAGYFVVNRNKRYFAAMAGFHNGSHKHADELSFELFDRDTRVITGPGKYGFNRDKRREYVLSNEAHSTLTIDGKAWPRDNKSAYGSGLVASGQGEKGWFALLGHNPLTERQGVSHARVFLYHPLVGLFILDRLESRSGKHRYSRHLQFGERVDLTRQNKRALRLSSRGDFAGCVREESSPPTGSGLRLVRGRKDPLAGYTFPRTGKPVPRWTATWRSKARDASHLLGIGLQRGCPFSVRRVDGPGILDLVLIRGNHRPVQLSVTQDGPTLYVTETKLDEEPPPPVEPLPPLPPLPPYEENP